MTRYEALFDRIGAVAEAARVAICAGQTEALGPLMDQNHALLQEIGVSCPELDALVAAARGRGARRQALRRRPGREHDRARDRGDRFRSGRCLAVRWRRAGDRVGRRA